MFFLWMLYVSIRVYARYRSKIYLFLGLNILFLILLMSHDMWLGYWDRRIVPVIWLDLAICFVSPIRRYIKEADQKYGLKKPDIFLGPFEK
jgi:hypothetical protein